ncbi:MAG: arsenate reductase (glutaredoxin) [Marinobacter sp.]|uniref:arsenate reductase (glutaredoxin) n=1 Tax=Marinobacter sp. TaxID=50741 RepID=UPI00299CDE54|nr:arsenate reductase (glutaredoxin) [Marinobacter sp.]MDX1757658.1 arsenate reductase (glutaredoxin) [Marinobacter sp.]
MTEPTRIFHNPRCSKSRQTLALLEENGVQPEIIRYLDTPPSAEELSDILQLLHLEPRELMRTKESLYKELNLADPALGRDALIQAMVDNPKLIERPIVIRKGKAVLGRPPENVLDLL